MPFDVHIDVGHQFNSVFAKDPPASQNFDSRMRGGSRAPNPSRKSSLTPRGGRESRVSRLRDAAGAVVDAVGDLRRPSPTPRQPQPEARRGTAIVTRGQEGLISDAI